MGHLDHAAYGWLTPALSYVMASIGAALGLRCTVRALAATGPSRRNWLLTAASALATCIWTMHFIAMLGFHITGTEIHYNVPLTLLSLLVAVLVVGAGLFAVGYGRDRGRSLVLGGLTTGLGVASMHYLGMAALRLHGRVAYDPLVVGISIAIAVVAATAALWAALHISSPLAVTGASLLMGAAVSSMHYTGMMAVTVRVTPSAEPLPGATALQFIFPLAVGLGSYLFVTAAFVALSPTGDERALPVRAAAPGAAAAAAAAPGPGPGTASGRASGPAPARLPAAAYAPRPGRPPADRPAPSR
ncbi:NO-binding membrane sensor protein with MHYT domain [Streptomyces sp. Ag109_G2-6]|uniref:MHYT domain-containing protein n=1 Tax=Streptomyces TaxID=1883 RepID=UPI0009A4A867|nr:MULTISPECIES: MHYT domain-containing protein [Streptomyces]RPF29285.1 NO-binding membrane sensor protein with MHYT domain [Streptomyces sp. Ag109_G2-6]